MGRENSARRGTRQNCVMRASTFSYSEGVMSGTESSMLGRRVLVVEEEDGVEFFFLVVVLGVFLVEEDVVEGVVVDVFLGVEEDDLYVDLVDRVDMESFPLVDVDVVAEEVVETDFFDFVDFCDKLASESMEVFFEFE